jgi:7-cyano-7-deazaguanine synthase
LQKKSPSFIITTGPVKMEQNVVLFSGGIDSTTALYWSLQQNKQTTALTFDYGQRNEVEIEGAQRTADSLEVPLKLLRVDLEQIGGSPLTDPSLSLPRFDHSAQIKKGLPSTYVPFRNGIFLALGAAWAEATAKQNASSAWQAAFASFPVQNYQVTYQGMSTIVPVP